MATPRGSFAADPARAIVRAVAALSAIALAACGDAGPGLHPVISDVTPQSGPASGRTFINITGAHFVDVTSVTIGGRALDSLSVVDSTHINGITPNVATPSSADIVVTSS